MRLYWRIWWVVLVLMVLGMGALVALWRLDVQVARESRPGDEVVVRDWLGQEIGYGRALAQPRFGPPTQFQVVTEGGEVLWIELPPPAPGPRAWHAAWWTTLGWGGGVAVVGLIIIVVAWPMVRRLTGRLEALTRSVRRWGDGDLSVRLPEEGQDEVADLARHFNAAAQRIEALVASHKYLLAHASHELRSPLARMRMGLGLLEAQRVDAQTLAELGRNIEELDQLVDEVLLASRLEHNPDDLPLDETVDLMGLVTEECARVGARLHASGQAWVTGNSALLRRVLRNLLENARRHAGEGAASTIDVCIQDASDGLRVQVADRGPGIPEAWRERVFEPFVRVPGMQEKQGSVGLGLALVRLIAQRHGAQVSVRARDGGGSVFELLWAR
jgi:signal transduction histidine kinase